MGIERRLWPYARLVRTSLGVLVAMFALVSCVASGAVRSSAPTIHPLASLTCAAVRAAVRAAAPSPPPTPISHERQTYSLALLGPLPVQRVWQPGSMMRVTWCPVPDQFSANAQPTPETLSVQLVGPFTSRAAAVAAQRVHAVPLWNPQSAWPPTEVAVLLKQPLHTNTWANTQLTATLPLPTTLASGYYIFVAMNSVTLTFPSDVAEGSGSVSGIISIT